MCHPGLAYARDLESWKRNDAQTDMTVAASSSGQTTQAARSKAFHTLARGKTKQKPIQDSGK